MNPSVKEALDLRLARGEISEAEYRSLLKTLSVPAESSDQTQERGVIGALVRAAQNTTKAIDRALIGDTEKERAILSHEPTNDDPLRVSDEFCIYGDHFAFKGVQVMYDQIVSLSYSVVQRNYGTTSGMPLWMSCKSTLAIHLKEAARRIDIRAKASSLMDLKSLLIKKAYELIRIRTFSQRMHIYREQLKSPGFIVIDGAHLYRNGNIARGATRINLYAARQNNMMQVGTTFGGDWTMITGSRISETNPNEVIVGENGLGALDRRVKFEVDRDHDVLFTIIDHLSEGIEI